MYNKTSAYNESNYCSDPKYYYSDPNNLFIYFNYTIRPGLLYLSLHSALSNVALCTQI